MPPKQKPKPKPKPSDIPLKDQNLDKLKVSELRALCAENNLGEGGRKEELIERLRDFVSGQNAQEQAGLADMPQTPESMDTGECPAVLVASCEIGEESEMIETAHKSLTKTLDEDELLVDGTAAAMAVGNRRGLSLAMLPLEVAVLKTKISGMEENYKVLDTRIASLQGQVYDLTRTAEAHTALRNRFIVFYKRDKLPDKTLDDFDKQCIEGGDAVAHGGNAKADLRLYNGFKARQDFSTYELLYGFHPDIVARIDHPQTLALINFHATVKASNRQTGSENFYTLFAQFVKRFKEGEYQTDYLTGNPTTVTKAYGAFWACVGEEFSEEFLSRWKSGEGSG